MYCIWYKFTLFVLITQIYPEGKMSQCVKSWKVGDTAEWRGPFGSLHYTANQVGSTVL